MRRINLLIPILSLCILIMSAMAQPETPPPGGQPKDFSLPAIQTFSLENGLKARIIPFGDLPKVLVRVVVQAGNLNESASETWIADLTAALLKEGTRSHSASDIARQVAEMGGTISIITTMDQSWIEGEVLSEFAPQLMTLLADILMYPVFPEKEFDRLKNDFIRRLSISKSEPQSLAEEKFLQVLYPEHPYGRLFPAEDLLKSFTLDQLKAFYQLNYGAARTQVYVAGKFVAADVEKTIRTAFSSWHKGPDPLMNIPQPQSRRLIHLVDRPGAPQSTLYLGLPVIDPTHPDYIKLSVANMLLGGYFSSRITANIREDKGYTYSPASGITSHYRDAFWRQEADVTTSVTGASLKEIFYEIERLQQEAPAPGELEGVQNFMAGRFILRNSSRGGVISQLAYADLHGLPDDYLPNYIGNILAVSPQDIQEMAQRYLKMDEMSIVIVGDPRLVLPQVKKFAPLAGQ